MVAATALIGASGWSTAYAERLAPRPATVGPGLEGTLMVAHGDNFATGAMIMQTELRTASAVVPLTVPRSEHAQIVSLAGQQVQMRGARLAASVVVSAVSPMVARAASTPVARSMRVAVVLLRLPGTTAEPVTKAAVQSSVFGATKSVADWYSQTSGGQVAVTGTVYGYYDGVRSCDLATELSVGAAAAAKDGYVASNYTNLVVYTPDQACNFSGMAWIGVSGVFLNGTVLPGVIEHELGHNLGLMHAGASACGAAPVSAGCLIDYGDPTDVMGDPSLDHGYNAEHKYMLGWIPSTEVRIVTTGNATIALTAAEDPLVAGSTELIHVRAADGTLFAIDRRASVGYDVGLSGVWIREVADVQTDDTELLTPGALLAGETFTDTAHDVTIKTLTDRGPTASIQVCVGPCAAPDATQTVSGAIAGQNITTASKTASANSNITLTVPSGRAVAAGRTVIVSTSASSVAGPVSCRDSRGDVYRADVNSLEGQRLIVCAAPADVGLRPGATITIRYPSFDGTTVSTANDFSGLGSSARDDKVSVASANSAAIDSGRTPRTTRPAELVFGVVMHDGAATFAADAGYTHLGGVRYRSANTQMTINPEFKIVSSDGAFTVGGMLSSRQRWHAAVITFFG
ncbi:MAG: hypothetical protein ACLPVY_05955 [Acidimicrobiia bacterium]